MTDITEPVKPKKPKMKTCELHGQYELRKFAVGPKVFESGVCPDCATIHHVKNAISVEEQDEARSSNAELKMRKIGVSKRLMNLTFDDFVSDTDRKAHALALCKRTASDLNEGRETPNLMLLGGVGTGKTLLACSIAKAIMAKRRVRIIKAVELFQEIKDSFNGGDSSEKKIIEFYGRLDLLIIDEIGIGTKSEFESNVLFRVVDKRNGEVKPTIIISNLGISALGECIDKRTIDRLSEDGGKFVGFDWESYRK